MLKLAHLDASKDYAAAGVALGAVTATQLATFNQWMTALTLAVGLFAAGFRVFITVEGWLAKRRERQALALAAPAPARPPRRKARKAPAKPRRARRRGKA